jgi:hypothetical protein
MYEIIILSQVMLIVMLLILNIRDLRTLKKQEIRMGTLLKRQQTIKRKLRKPSGESRKYFRVMVLKECTIQFIESENVGLNKLRNRTFPGLIENLSIGGLKFSCSINLPIKDMINVTISFSFYEQDFSLNAQIIRKEVEMKKNVGYGVQFIDMNAEDIKRLNEVIHKIELEKRKVKS